MKSKLLLATCITMALSVTIVSAQKTEKSNDIRSIYTNNSETTLDFSRDGHDYRVKMSGKQVTEIYRDDNKVPPEDFSKYDSIIKEILAVAEKNRKEADEQRKVADKMRAEAEKNRTQADKMRQEADGQRAEATKMRATADENRAQADKQRGQADEQRKQSEVNRANAEKQRGEADKQRVEADKQRSEADKMREQAEVQRQQANEFRAQADVQRKQADKQRALADLDRELMDKMLDEIVSEKIVTNREDLKDILLNETEFSVNGVKQSDKLHQQFKAKYLKGKRIKYQVTANSRGISIE